MLDKNTQHNLPLTGDWQPQSSQSNVRASLVNLFSDQPHDPMSIHSFHITNHTHPFTMVCYCYELQFCICLHLLDCLGIFNKCPASDLPLFCLWSSSILPLLCLYLASALPLFCLCSVELVEFTSTIFQIRRISLLLRKQSISKCFAELAVWLRIYIHTPVSPYRNEFPFDGTLPNISNMTSTDLKEMSGLSES